MTDRLAKYSAVAGVMAALVAIVSLVLQIISPDTRMVQLVEEKLPFHSFLLSLFAFVTLVYYLINKLAARIGDISLTLHGDVVTTKDIGDYIRTHPSLPI